MASDLDATISSCAHVCNAYVHSFIISLLKMDIVSMMYHNNTKCSYTTPPTGEHHGLGALEPRKGFHRVVLVIQRVSDLSLLHILHTCYHVAHLACIATRTRITHIIHGTHTHAHAHAHTVVRFSST